jgi:hypothetical protein
VCGRGGGRRRLGAVVRAEKRKAAVRFGRPTPQGVGNNESEYCLIVCIVTSGI